MECVNMLANADIVQLYALV